jgi:hypothetical protein
METPNSNGEMSDLRSNTRDVRVGAALYTAFLNGLQVFSELGSTGSNAECGGVGSQFCHSGMSMNKRTNNGERGSYDVLGNETKS